VPTGRVTFREGADALGTADLDESGVATLTLDDLAVGSHWITASYEGDDDYAPATGDSLEQVVEQAETTTTLASSTHPSVVGSEVTFTATVSVVEPGAGAPTGTVVFRYGDVELGESTLDDGGVATF